MLIYHYNQETQVFLGTTEALLDPLGSIAEGKDVYLIPAHATTKKPPDLSEGHIAKYINREWILEPIPEPELLPKAQPLTEEESNEAHNNTIKMNLEIIDRKRIRAICEGDTEWLERYNAQVKEEREKLIK